MEIRHLREGDEHVVHQAAHLFDTPPDAESTHRFLREETHHLLIAYVDEVPAGFISGVEMTHPDKDAEMFLYELGVEEPFRRRGIATALVEALADLARANGCCGMWVAVDDDNAAALLTYASTGASREQGTTAILSWTLAEEDRG